jgi:hypothetical protein
MVQRYERPPRLFLNPEQWIPFFGFSILAAPHKLVHCPQLAVITKLLPRGLALHASVPCHGLFSKSHGLESQVSRHEDFGGGDVARGCILNGASMATVLGDKHAALIIIKYM